MLLVRRVRGWILLVLTLFMVICVWFAFELRAGANQVCIRQLDGLELMQLIGLPIAAYRGDCPSHKLATQMSGNAFSGFAIGPCLLAAISAIAPGRHAAEVMGEAAEVFV